MSSDQALLGPHSLHGLVGKSGSDLDIEFDYGNYVYSGSTDKTVRKISPSGSQGWSFTEHTDRITFVVVDADGYVYSGSWDGTVRKISPSGSQVWSFTGHTSRVNGIAVDADGYVYSGSSDNTVRKISSSGSQVWSFTEHTNTVSGVAVDPGSFGAFHSLANVEEQGYAQVFDSRTIPNPWSA